MSAPVKPKPLSSLQWPSTQTSAILFPEPPVVVMLIELSMLPAGLLPLLAFTQDPDELLACPLSRVTDIAPGLYNSLHLPLTQTSALP
jgi:hypothetical protein